MIQQPDILYVADLARLMSRTEASLRAAINRGADWVPPSFHIGRRLAWRRSDVDAWFAKQAREVRR